MKILKGGFWPPFNCLPVSINIFSAEGADVSGEDDPLRLVHLGLRLGRDL